MGVKAYDFSTASTVLGVSQEVDTGAGALREVADWRWFEWLDNSAVRGAHVRKIGRAVDLSERNRGKSENDSPSELHGHDRYLGERASDLTTGSNWT